MIQDNGFMDMALAQAREAAKLGEVPVGAVIVNPQGQVIAKAHNLTRNQQNPILHAEMIAIQTACNHLKSERLIGCDLYVSLEPCAMCAGAISHARLRRVYFAALDPKGGAIENGPRWFDQATCFHAPEVIFGQKEAEAKAMLSDFFQKLRLNQGAHNAD